MRFGFQEAGTTATIELSRATLAAAVALAVAVAMLGLSWQLDHALSAFWLFGLAFGFVLQRSRFCFHAAFRDLFLLRQGRMMKAILAGLAVATPGFAWVMVGRVAQPTLGFRPVEAHVVPLGLNVVLGGFLFGLGMMLSRGCISRSLCHMGEGYVASWISIGGVLLGLSLTAHTWNRWWLSHMQFQPLVWLPNTLGYGGALLATFAALAGIYLLVRWWEARGTPATTTARTEGPTCQLANAPAGGPQGGGRPLQPIGSKNGMGKVENGEGIPPSIFHSPLSIQPMWDRLFSGGWPALAGGVILGLLNVALYTAYQPWGITGELSRWAEGVASLVGLSAGPLVGIERLPSSCSLSGTGSSVLTKGFMLNVGMVLGAFLAAVLAREFRVRVSERRYYAQSAAGGVLMGYGAGLAVGCTIGAFFSAVPSLALNGWAFGLTLALGAYLGLRLVKQRR